MGSSSASCVVVQLGQGGNQLYTSFFTAMANLANQAGEDTGFFREGSKGHQVARAVLIDMEPKVIAAAMKRAAGKSATSWRFCPDRQFTQDSGSGNNWARGFYVHGPRCRDAISNVIRLEVEACDLFGGFITAQSVAGGTGSGLGAYVMEMLQDEYPFTCMLSHCIWPFESGEVIVQNYNALLTLAKLQESADGIILSQNESLASICRKALGIPRPSFEDMNDVVAQSLASIFLPASWRPVDAPCERDEHPRKAAQDKGECVALGGLYGAGMPVRLLPDLVSKLCAHPGYRMLSLRFTPQISPKSLDFTTFNWRAQTKQLQQMLVTGALGDFDMDWNTTLPNKGASTSAAAAAAATRFKGTRTVNRCLANLLVLRGLGSHNADVSGFAHESLYPIWSVDPLSVAMNSARLGKYEMSAGLLSNCQSSVMCTFRALSRAYRMFASKAYLHQYFRHGMEEASFEGAFATAEDVISRYLEL